MICDGAEEFAAALPRDGAVAGLDLGTVTIGSPVSDLRGGGDALRDGAAEPSSRWTRRVFSRSRGRGT
jgi:hypothetical protein